MSDNMQKLYIIMGTTATLGMADVLNTVECALAALLAIAIDVAYLRES